MIKVGEPEPVVRYEIPGGGPEPLVSINGGEAVARLGGQEVRLVVKRGPGRVIVEKRLGLREHAMGLGEKALPVDRTRTRTVFWNTDRRYQEGSDPLYASIPFVMFVEGGRAVGLFINEASRVVFDIGYSFFDKAVFELWSDSAEVYVIFGPSPGDVLDAYTKLTGRPFVPPLWALGHQLSRYSYYPQDYVMRVVEEAVGEAPLSAIYLDIDYMEGYKQFTWDGERFPDPRLMIKRLHEKGVRVVVVIDPYIKIDPDYEVFRESLGFLVRRAGGEIFVGLGWPGYSALPDFFNKKARGWWASRVERFVREYGVDGVWLDMNEPSTLASKEAYAGVAEERLTEVLEDLAVLHKYKLASRPRLEDEGLGGDVVHVLDDGRVVPHPRARNAYPLYQAMATYQALKRVHDKPFILSRSGYPGIQSYAAIWTGDNLSSWEHLRLSIPMVLGLSVSGVPWAGVDVGGFTGRCEPELAARWYQACALFPIFRVHKERGDQGQEVFSLPGPYKEMAKRAIKLRYEFMPYLWHLAWVSHHTGSPVVRPLAYEFPEDEEAFSINDEYMVGPSLLYAPIVEKGVGGRLVYLPRGEWVSVSSGSSYTGPAWVESDSDTPLYVRRGGLVPVDGGLLVYGECEGDVYHGDGLKTRVRFRSGVLTAEGDPMGGVSWVAFVGLRVREAVVGSRRVGAEAVRIGSRVGLGGEVLGSGVRVVVEHD